MNENILIALIGISGAIIGSLGTLAGQWQVHRLKVQAEKSKDEPRRKLLLKMLESDENDWRSLETLSHVIGADKEKTKNLLIDIGARASEDGKELWALIKNKPFK
ncbi:MAG: hypothetical protein RH860_11515 [Cytophagales bacterium]